MFREVTMKSIVRTTRVLYSWW